MQRSEEILVKKARLAELRRQREEREQRQREYGRRTSVLPGEESSDLKVPTPTRSTERKDLDSLIDTLVGDRPGSRGPGNASPARRKSRPSSTLLGGVQVGSETYDQNGAASRTSQYVSSATQTSSTGDSEDVVVPAPAPDVPIPKEKTYESRFAQTSEEWPVSRRRISGSVSSGSDSDGSRSPSRQKSGDPSRRRQEREAELRENLRREIEEELQAAKDLTMNGNLSSQTSRFPIRGLTTEELNAVTSSEDFQDFVDRSSKVIEKALDQDFDVMADYTLVEGSEYDEDEDEGYVSSGRKKGRRLRQVAQFYQEKFCGRRMISDLNFSSKFSELLLTSYTKSASAPQDQTSLLHVWNLHLHSRPEYTFHSTSDVLSAIFSPFHPSIIIGGTYTGQVMLWDTRARSPLPVAKTPLTGASSGGHTHPVYSISLVGTQNANNIISCSTDGVVCGWTTDMLTLPQEYLELTSPPPAKTEDLAPTCMTFPESDPTSFLVGTEEGTIFPCHRYDRAGAKAGVDTKLRYRAHTAPIMSLDFHPARGPLDLGDLAISTSLDWSIKVWKTKPASSAAVQAAASSRSNATAAASAYGNPNAATTSAQQIVEPILDISREDVVYSAKWSPHRPGVFASVDGTGNLDVWDLTVDTEIPVARASPNIDRSVPGLEGPLPKSLGKVAWEQKEGKRLAVGGAAGVVTVFEVGSELGGEGVRTEEWARMKRFGGDR